MPGTMSPLYFYGTSAWPPLCRFRVWPPCGPILSDAEARPGQHCTVVQAAHRPMLASQLIPRSMCSWIPKPKFPVWEKLFFLNSYSPSFRPLSGIPSALAPRTVQWVATVSSLLLPNDLMVHLGLGVHGGLASALLQHLGCPGSVCLRFPPHRC